MCKSSNKIDDNRESAETDRQSAKSSNSVTHNSSTNSSSNKQLQQHHCIICKVTLHNSGDQQTHLFSKAHRAAEQVYTRGMLAAIQYMAKCLSIAPAPPSSTAVAAAAVPASLSPLSDDYLNTSLNPALRALVEGLQQHEGGLAWRSFIRAVAAGCGAVDQWQRHLLFPEDGADDYLDEDGDDFDDEADIYEY